MVADIRERSRGFLAAAVLALVLAAALPPTFAQDLPQPPSGQGFELHVKQGEAVIRAGNSATLPALKFLDGNRSSSYYATFPVYNSGTATSDANIPIYYWFEENTTAMERGWKGAPLVRCVSMGPGVPGATAAGWGKRDVGFFFDVPTDFRRDPNDPDPLGGSWVNAYTMRILVNREPTGLPAFHHVPPSNCPGARYTAPTSPFFGSPTAQDKDPSGNMLAAYFVKDARLDLVVDQVKWCRGSAHLASGYDQEDDDYKASLAKVCDRDATTDATTQLPHYTSNMLGPGSVAYNSSRKAETQVCSDDVPPVCNGPFNVMNATYFEVKVGNTPDATWKSHVDYGGACAVTSSAYVNATTGAQPWHNTTLSSCPGFPVTIDVRIANLTENVRASNVVLTNRSQRLHLDWTSPDNVFRSVTWHVINWTGPFRLYASVNDNGFPEVVSTNNDRVYPDPNPAEDAPPQWPLEVAWADYDAEFVPGELKTTPSDPYPYRPQSTIRIAGHVMLRNHGTDVPTLWRYDADGKAVHEPKRVTWRVTLDNKTTVGAVLQSTDIGNASKADWLNVSFVFENSTIADADNYLAPGKHWLCARIDATNQTRETNKSNNEECVPIYLSDSRVPVFDDIDGKTSPRITRLPAYNDTLATSVYPKEPFFVHSNATDDDLPSLNVTAQFTLTSNASIVRNYTMTRNPAFQNKTFSVYVTDFNFTSPNGTMENWTVKVYAKDAFGNNDTSPAQPLQLKRWPIQTAPVGDVVLGIPGNASGYYEDGYAFNYSDDSVLVRWRFIALENQTGIADQPNVTSNLGIRFFTPRNTTYFVNGSGFSKFIDCTEDTIGGLPKGSLGCTNIGHFLTPHAEKDEGGPGRWYAHIEITDKGGDVRVINRSFLLRDALPTIWNHSISAPSLEAGQDLNVKVNMTDDFAVDVDNGGARVNFTRVGDNKTFSIELKAPPASVQGGVATYAFNKTIETGFGKPLDEAGEFDVTFAARDNQGNWNATAPIRFKLNDTRAPDMHQAGPDTPVQEVGQNVTFKASVTDQTNVTVTLRVRPAGSDESVLSVNLAPTGPGSTNYTYTTNFSKEGNYLWEIRARDSAGLTSNLMEGPLTVADNLGPRFQVVEPGHLKDGKRYGRAAPLISLIVSDTHGVARDSINLSVDGKKVTHDAPVPTTGGLSGFIVNYTVPASERFQHGEVVTVNVTALDLSGRSLRGYANFTFTVDDTAPTVRVKDFAPRFPLEGVGMNVSLKTRFTLEASDPGDVSTGVESIRYTIIGGGNSQLENVYNDEPFTIADVPGVYTGPKSYQIQYWAVDGVGNRKMVNGRASYEALTVYVDGVPPELDQFASLPEGQFINATITDQRSGVDRVIAWYSVNGAPYVPMPLDFVAGIWKGVLPEGKKGDTVAYYLEAFDRVENRETFGNATAPYTSYVVGNHNPTIRITSPTDGGRIQRTVNLEWVAGDEDGDALVFTIFVKEPGATSFRELAKLEAGDTRRYPLDTTDFADGEYTFRVSVNDGSRNADSSVTVTILNRASAFGSVTRPPGEVEAGTPVVLQVEVTKAQATVEARIYLDDRLVQAYPMNDEGRDGDEVARDGKYSTRVNLDDNGRYRVEFHARYQEDGVQKEATIAGGEFVVQGGGIGALGWWLVAIGLLVVVGVAAAAVVLVRGRKS